MTSSPGDKGGPPSKVGAGRFSLQQRLGAGIFAEVYRGVDHSTGEAVAIKLEDQRDGDLQLDFEAVILADLADPERRHGFAQCFYSGEEGMYNCLVMDLLGMSLEDHLTNCGGTFNATTSILIAEQGIHRLRYLHSKGYIHRDVKPENFVMGLGAKAHHLYLIDFGLSKRYFKDRHIPLKYNVGMVGTPRYASLNALRGTEQSRRDDLESVGYLIIRFCVGTVPWSGLGGTTQDEKYRKILNKKEACPLGDLCKGLPSAFPKYVRKTRSLGFEETPDYDFLLDMFADARSRHGPEQDHEFQWLVGVKLGQLDPMELPEDLEQPDEAAAVESSVSNPFFALAAWFTNSCSSTANRSTSEIAFAPSHRSSDTVHCGHAASDASQSDVDDAEPDERMHRPHLMQCN